MKESSAILSQSEQTKKYRRRKYNNRLLKENAELYLIMLPVLILIFIFSYIPMYGIIIAFQNYLPGRSFLAFDGSTQWVGLKHFRDFLQSPMFPRIFGNTIRLTVMGFVFGFPVPIIFALLVNELRDNKFKKFVQTASYMPHFISAVVVAGMVLSFISVDGLVNQILGAFGVPAKPYNVNPDAFPWVYTITSIWKSFGWSSILYLSTISSIDPGLYEAAKIDGATRFQRMLYITLPSMTNLIMIQLIFTIGSLISSDSGMILLLYNPATYKTADVIGTYVYRDGLMGGRFSYGTAVNIFSSFINVTLLAIANRISTKVTDFGLW